ncbi:MAG: ATP-binding cassette domain-containing protein [Gemmatimonadetes bacterium]|nr:ATP-binding cassette domain-containing protein [Gemmatimonadota bacterium]
MSVIKLQNVCVEHWEQPILVDANIEINQGEFVYLVGQTEAEKRAILELIIFAELPRSGVVSVGEYDSRQIRKTDIPQLRRQVGVVFQDFKLLHHRTVYENVAFALEVTGVSRRWIKRKTQAILSDVDLLHKRNAYPDELSGDGRLRVAIARALVNDPLVLLADEPTANLDTDATEQVMAIFKKMNARGIAVIIATREAVQENQYPWRILQLENGVVEQVTN